MTDKGRQPQTTGLPPKGATTTTTTIIIITTIVTYLARLAIQRLLLLGLLERERERERERGGEKERDSM